MIEEETLEDIVLQIWNDGAEGIIYDKEDLKEFEGRIKESLRARKTLNKETQHNN